MRRELKITDRIEDRAERIREELEQYRNPEKQKETKEKGKEEDRNELFRRRSGTGRADVLKRD